MDFIHLLPLLTSTTRIIRQTSLSYFDLDKLLYSLPELFVLANTLNAFVVRAELYHIPTSNSSEYLAQIPSNRTLSILIHGNVSSIRIWISRPAGLRTSPIVNLPDKLKPFCLHTSPKWIHLRRPLRFHLLPLVGPCLHTSMLDQGTVKVCIANDRNNNGIASLQ